jgi:hypothetical protein
MPLQFEDRGVRFQYPEGWQLEREESDSGWSVTVQSPQTAFLVISVNEEMPSVDEVAETTLEALRSEYPELEAEECVDTLAGQPAVGHDMQFFSFDLTNTCRARTIYTDSGTMLVMWQANDLELPAYEPVLRAICASLEVDAD